MSDDTVRLVCVKCGQAYRAGTVYDLLHRCCLCGGELQA